MYSHFQYAILIIICLIFSTAHTRPKKDSNVSQAQAEQQTVDEALFSFLTKETDLSILDTACTNCGRDIDVLKDAIKIESKKESGREGSDRTATTTNANPLNGDNDETRAKDTSTKFSPEDTTSSSFNILYANNDNAIDILKAAANSLANNLNSTGIYTHAEEAAVMKYNTSNSSSENVEATFTTYTVTESPNPSDEIILSELTSLSPNKGAESEVGQKIDFHRSNVSLGTQEINSAGAEILKSISTTCGSLFGKRISFANETTLMEFPWTALLLYNTQIRYHCGGSLITMKYVLTAAHCVAQEFYELTGVRLGEHDITEPKDCAPDIAGDTICANTIDVDVVKIIIHHEYSHLSFKNDIALLRLDKDYISRSYYPICIPTSDMIYDDRTAIVAGWGATEKAIRSTVLLKANIPIHDISKCRETYRYSVFNDTTEICGSGANKVDVCKGDSGGALFYRKYVKSKEKFYQMGIISMGVRRCGDSRLLPAVFTKLTGFYNWIENNLEY